MREIFLPTSNIEKGNVLKNSWWLLQKKCLYWLDQSEEEVGSAEEQPTSNKIDAYTENEGSF